MIETLRRNPAFLYLLILSYFALQVIFRLSLPPSLELDEGQQLFLAQWLSVGYDSQPPFYNWLQYGSVQLFGNSVAALSLLKNAMLFLCYLFYGMTASLLLRNRDLAIIATLGLITIPQISYEAQRDLTHTVAVVFAACLFLYAFVRTLKTPSFSGYLLTGVAIGIGMISKYNFALLPAAALVAILPEENFRRRLFDPRIMVTAAAAAVIMAPHAFWFLQNTGLATERTLGKMTEGENGGLFSQVADGLFSLSAATAGFSALTVVLFMAIFGRKFLPALRAQNEWTRLIERMLLAILIAIVGMILFAGTDYIKDRWLAPFFVILPLYLCLKVETAEIDIAGSLRRGLWVAGVLAVAVTAVLYLRVPLAAWTGDYQKVNIPFGPAIEKILAEEPHRPAVIVADRQPLAGNIRLHVPDIPVLVPGYEQLETHAWDADNPVLLVWRRDGRENPQRVKVLDDWLKSHPAYASLPLVVKDVGAPYHYGRDGDLYHFGYAWIYPPDEDVGP
ncbi:MAG: glycosyltransferase family 39 protein [Shinella sp.]|nr:glycosyltransferase family 39 protein [Shinella sp.]